MICGSCTPVVPRKPVVKHFQRLFAALLWASLAAAQIVPGHYIVELSGEPVAVGAARVPVRWRADFARDRRSMIRAEQGFVRRILERDQTSVLDSVDTVANALLVKMPDHQAAWLGSLPGIRRIRPVYEIKPALEHAIPLHKAPEAWIRLGGDDLAGAGAKIEHGFQASPGGAAVLDQGFHAEAG